MHWFRKKGLGIKVISDRYAMNALQGGLYHGEVSAMHDFPTEEQKQREGSEKVNAIPVIPLIQDGITEPLLRPALAARRRPREMGLQTAPVIVRR
jgi:hypothetical protein